MESRNENQHALSAAIVTLLRPLVRLMLRYGVPYGVFADMAKQVYVDIAMSEFTLQEKKQTVSRTSVITGLSRKEVSRVLKLPGAGNSVVGDRYNRASRVIAAWVREPEYCDSKGNPLELSIDGNMVSFSSLVKVFSGDVPARAVLDELVRVGAVEKKSDNVVVLKSRSYVPVTGEPEKMQILGRDVAGLISTIDHNLDPQNTPYFQRKVFYDNLPDEAVNELQVLTREHGQALIELLDKWMSQHDRDDNPSVAGTGRNRIGIGVYYFEETQPTEA